MLHGFKYAPGFTNWKVFGNDMNEYNHYEQVPEGLKYGKQIHCGMFPDEEFNKKNKMMDLTRIRPIRKNRIRPPRKTGSGSNLQEKTTEWDLQENPGSGSDRILKTGFDPYM